MYPEITEADIKICNRALGRMGGKKISSFGDSTPEERDCELFYAETRDEILESFGWSFCKKRATLVQGGDTPDFGYSYSFGLPSDCLQPVSINTSIATAEPDWVSENGFLLTNEEEVNLKYKASVGADKFSPSFKSAFILLLASRLAMSVAKNAKLADSLENKYIQYVASEAMTINAATSREEEYTPSTYEDARS